MLQIQMAFTQPQRNKTIPVSHKQNPGISQRLVREHGLTQQEYAAIKRILERTPTYLGMQFG